MQYDDTEFTLATCVLHDAAKLGCDHRDTINNTEIRLKTSHTVPASKFVVEYVIEGSSAFDEASRISKTMVAKLTAHVAENVFELFM